MSLFERVSVRTMAISLSIMAAILMLLLVPNGLPLDGSADECFILQEPFKLLRFYASGDFFQKINLFYWLLLVWQGLVCVGGFLTGAWQSPGAWIEHLVLASPLLIAWGRIFSTVMAAAGAFLLVRTLGRTVTDKWLVLLGGAILALNPYLLVSGPWLKFDGFVVLLNAIIISLLVTYVQTDHLAARRRFYVVALVGGAVRPDLLVIPVVVFISDWLRGKSVRPIWGAIGLGLGLDAAFTLIPISLLVKFFSPGHVSHYLTGNSNMESQIVSNMVNTFSNTALLKAYLNHDLFYYGSMMAIIGPMVVAAVWLRRRTHLPADIHVVIAIGMLLPTLVYWIVGARYFLLPATYLMFAAIWRFDTIKGKLHRYGWLGLTALSVLSTTASTMYQILTSPNQHAAALAYVFGHTRATDVIGLETLAPLGSYAFVPESVAQTAERVAAIRESGHIGSGESLALLAKRPRQQSRRNIAIDTVDPYVGTHLAGRLYNQYDADRFVALSPRPALVITMMPFDSPTDTPARRAFSRTFLQHYRLVEHLATPCPDPRVRVLLTGTLSWYGLAEYYFWAPRQS